MKTRYIDDWDVVYDRFETWWAREPMDGPLLFVTAPRDVPLDDSPKPVNPGSPDKWLSADYLTANMRHGCSNVYFGGDAFPLINAPYGPGSLALYLGSEPVFAESTIWFEPCVDDLETTPLPEFDAENRWLRSHLDLTARLGELAEGDYYLTIPDIVETVDILSAMRDPQTFLFDLMDKPEACHRWLRRIHELYMPHYDAFYDLCKDTDGRSVFTCFNIIGQGKVCKLQCDFAAMLSPEMFGEFYIPYAREQLDQLDRSLYHLDGPDAICDLDHLLALEKLNAIQWVPGAGGIPQGDERWFPMYRKILDGGKGLHISVAADRVEPVLRAIGGRGVFINTHTENEREARELVALSKRLAPAT